MAQYKNGGRPYKVDGKVVGILVIMRRSPPRFYEGI